MVAYLSQHEDWNDELFRSLMGWKIISSMTHTLRYEDDPEKIKERTDTLAQLGKTLQSLAWPDKE